MKICIVCSGGGHMSQAISISRLIPDYDKYFVTYSLGNVKDRIEEMQTYFVINPHISKFKYLINAFQSLFIILKQRPKVIISTGSGIAIATCLLGKLIGAKIIFVESGSRVVTPSRTGKFLYRYADLFLIQWKSLQKEYPKAIYCGLLI